ncbi:MAG: aminotransferase class V-fold PLP-dependent enzyme [Alphaproteobacteria bacterium]|nr:aminotransferase class V-fold PLP-dependent enzyme [Alphaproteobacteria bacterium]
MKENFPIYKSYPSLVYLDSSATSLKPQVMIDAISHFYQTENAPVHRGTYALANHASELYEASRKTVGSFFHVAQEKMIFTSGATESLNLISLLFKDQKVLASETEHHSNLLPFLKNCSLELLPYDSQNYIDLNRLEEKLKTRTFSLLTLSGLSNVLGESPDLEKIISLAHQYNVKVCIDGAQLTCHTENLNLEKLNCDFFVFSGHKLYGPTGIGGLYLKDPQNYESPKVGGGMISDVLKNSFTPLPSPHGWEAGTPPVAQAIGLAETMQWLQKIQWGKYLQQEKSLLKILKHELLELEAKILGEGEKSLISCSFDDVNTEDLATMLGAQNICARAGKHCTHPLHCALNNSQATLRFSLGIYNDENDIHKTVDVLKKSLKRLR